VNRKQSRAGRSAAKNISDARRKGWRGRSKTRSKSRTRSKKIAKGKQRERDYDAASSVAWTDITTFSRSTAAWTNGCVLQFVEDYYGLTIPPNPFPNSLFFFTKERETEVGGSGTNMDARGIVVSISLLVVGSALFESIYIIVGPTDTRRRDFRSSIYKVLNWIPICYSVREVISGPEPQSVLPRGILHEVKSIILLCLK
jgi:hypothetical protein